MHAAALNVAENPGQSFNPLFIYGDSGLGKTHLLLAIGYAVRDRSPGKRIAYVKGEEFINRLVKAIQEHTTEAFRDKYRTVDLLLMDDIQFIAGKQSTQEEFFHTFNALYESGRQIVITSDRPPKEMTLLDDRLKTRFEGGLMADVGRPDLEMRIVITRKKAATAGLKLTDSQINTIAAKVKSNVRQLEGVINKLFAYQLMAQPITDEILEQTIEEATSTASAPSAEHIIRETGKYFGLTAEQLKSENRSRPIADARQIAMYLMRKLTPMSFADIGKEFGRNHTTTLSAVKKVEELMKTDAALAGRIRDIESNIVNTAEQ